MAAPPGQGHVWLSECSPNQNWGGIADAHEPHQRAYEATCAPPRGTVTLTKPALSPFRDRGSGLGVGPRGSPKAPHWAGSWRGAFQSAGSPQGSPREGEAALSSLHGALTLGDAATLVQLPRGGLQGLSLVEGQE